MQVLTPSGYKIPATLANGDEVCAFDLATGSPIINRVENIAFVDFAEWCQWWSVEESVPAFIWYRINGSFLLFREQSVWRNGTEVCHARDLVIGDEIYDDADHAVSISSIEEIEDDSLIWYRFDISGDHSYIVDGLTVHNASRFWVGGTGTWDSSSTTHWASSTGGSSGASVPGSGDAALFDASSGGGTVTVNFGGTITIQSIQWGAFTGTLDFATNNNSVTLSAASNAFNGTGGTAARTFNMGNGTWSLTTTTTNSGSVWTIPNNTNLTFHANSSTINLTGSAPSGTGARVFQSHNVTYNNITFSGAGCYQISLASTSVTFGAISLGGKTNLIMPTSGTVNASSIATTSSISSLCSIMSDVPTTQATLSISAGTQTLSWVAMRDVNCTGGATFSATSSFDLGNSGITITSPAAGGGSFGVIGS